VTLDLGRSGAQQNGLKKEASKASARPKGCPRRLRSAREARVIDVQRRHRPIRTHCCIHLEESRFLARQLLHNFGFIGSFKRVHSRDDSLPPSGKGWRQPTWPRSRAGLVPESFSCASRSLPKDYYRIFYTVSARTSSMKLSIVRRCCCIDGGNEPRSGSGTTNWTPAFTISSNWFTDTPS